MSGEGAVGRSKGFVGREFVAGLNVLTLSLPISSAAGVVAYAPLGG